MALFIFLLVVFTGYALALAPLGVLTGILIALGCWISWDEKRHPSAFGGGGFALGFGVMSLICTWLIAVLVRVLNAPPFPWRECVRALAWICHNILFR